MAEADDSSVATTVVLSYSPPTDRAATELDAESYRSYLRRARRGLVAVGDEWEEFVNTGCGTTEDVVLRVEAIDGGSVIGDETVFDFKSGET